MGQISVEIRPLPGSVPGGNQHRYASASDVVRAGLRLLEERETALAALRTAIDEGERGGPPEPLDIDAFVAVRRARG